MKLTLRSICSLWVVLMAGIGACAAADAPKTPEGYAAAYEFHTLPGSVQIYTCSATPNGLGSYSWTGPNPDARLSGSGLQIHHYKGPVWEAADGSIVHGSNAKHFPPPRPNSVDWLELDASGGTGKFAAIRYIHRINTSGGVQPAGGCDASHAGEQARVPYNATYIFYAPAK